MSGPCRIHEVHAPVLDGRITGHSHSGTTAVRIDLSAVTHRGSAAVRVLADAATLAATQNTPLTLIAPPGSTAHHVLTPVGLATVAEWPGQTQPLSPFWRKATLPAGPRGAEGLAGF